MNKIFQLEDEIFQNKVSFIKRFLIGLGFFPIDTKELCNKAESLYEKYKEILEKTPEEKRRIMKKFLDEIGESILALKEITYGLNRRSKDIEALNWLEYQDLIREYNKHKTEMIRLLEEVQIRLRS